MKFTTRKSGYVIMAALALLSVSGPLFAAAPPTVNFYLNGLGAPNILGGVYTSPYGARIGGTVDTHGNVTGGVQTPVICDDFASDSFLNEDWTAYVTQLTGATNSLTAGTWGPPDTYLKWGTSAPVVVDDTPGGPTNVTLNQLQAYDVAALLAIDIWGIPDTTGNATVLDDYSYAMWALFDTNQALAQISGTHKTQAMSYLQTAVYDVQNNLGNTGGSLSAYLSQYHVTIYSFDAGNLCYPGAVKCPNSPPQEFITVTTPEASSLAVFSVYLLFGGASLLFFGRRRGIFKANS